MLQPRLKFKFRSPSPDEAAFQERLSKQFDILFLACLSRSRVVPDCGLALSFDGHEREARGVETVQAPQLREHVVGRSV